MSTVHQQYEPGVLDRVQKPALVLGVLGFIALIIGWVIQPEHFYRSYLVGFILIVSAPLGSLALLMIQYLSGGTWGAVLRRPLEAATKTLPMVAALFIPVIIGMHHLYIWAQPEVMKHDHLLQRKAAYLNTPFWITRAVLFFIIWIGIAFFLNRLARRQEGFYSETRGRNMRRISAGGLVILALTLTLAAVDWVMSLDPHWFSTMFGISFMVGCLLTAMATMIIVMASLAQREPLAGLLTRPRFRDFANLLLAFTMLWAYTGFSQFLLIWYANIREEVTWYIVRTSGAWGAISVILLVGHFFLPFLLLLMRNLKEQAKIIRLIAILMIVMRILDYYWIIMPSFSHGGEAAHFSPHWLDLAAILGLGGLWVAAFLFILRKSSILPMHEPELQEVMHHG